MTLTLADLPTALVLEQVAPTVRPGGFGFAIVDPVAFTAWCAERGMTVEQYDRYLADLLTPKDWSTP